MLEKFGERCERLVRSYMPDPFVLVLLLTIFTFGLALWFTPSRPHELLSHWNLGFWELLSFAMQMVLIVVTGEAIAEARPVRRFIQKLTALPGSATSALLGLTFFSIVLGWLHWGFGLVMASLAGRELAKSLNQRKITAHYPLIGAAAYTSMLLWHAGTTASAPLLINTPGHFLFKEIGLIPLSETVFLPLNLLVCGAIALVVPFVIVQLEPRRGVRTIDEFAADLGTALKTRVFDHEAEEKGKTFAEKLERSYLVNAVVGVFGAVFLIHYFRLEGLNLNHNIVNFLLLSVGMILHRNPMSYARAVARSVKGTSGIILQFPFYGGIMGVMRESGLGHEIANVFVRLASGETLPLYAYLSSVLMKFFIPSGGGEWAVEGPVMLQAAKSLGAPVGLTTMGIAYGNMVGNMFQPFWAIPLLSIMGLKARDIMGYCLVIFFFVFPILAVALWKG
ncbi:MAG: short-chain fatty acid transporter [Deltaproteobacteria bacterium]|nr:short-chain fatty acid transporter [Deltaproteobacteria bacterium]